VRLLAQTAPGSRRLFVYNENSASWANDQRLTTNDESTFCMKKSELKQQVTAAIQACLEKKAEEISILEMEKGSGAFTDYFVLCSGTNPRQVQAIADEVELRLKKADVRPAHVEGYKQGEWILVDYVDFVVHVFSEKARKFYDLERLWKTAKRLEPAELTAKAKKKAAPRSKPTPRKRAAAAVPRRKKQ
jgi:ribosome-associated protein